MGGKFYSITKQLLIWMSAFLISLLAMRVYQIQSAPSLQLWHKYVPQELSIEELEQSDWEDYLQQEERIFEDVRVNVVEKTPPKEQTSINRFFKGSLIYPPNLAHDWNRSYLLEPTGTPVGVAVFLHGLTDSPYSLRHVAKRYTERGFVSIGLRVPGHGTVPAALTDVTWEDWMAATELVVREAKSRYSTSLPLHLVGFSNGGALAMMYALRALEDPALYRPDRLVLLSPMIGITSSARFAGIAGLPALFPAFAKAAWISVVPEFNPFKYNSFPVNGARQSHRLTVALRKETQRLSRTDKWETLPPVISFQSVIDSTVSTSAIVSSLYHYLPYNDSELVLFDVNRTASFGPLMRSASDVAITKILPPTPRNFRTTVISGVSSGNKARETTTEAASSENISRDLNLIYPPQIFSLSHVAIPFPIDDALYGTNPPPGSEREFGVNLGTVAARGERSTLIIDLDALFRIASNPFFPYVLERIDQLIDTPTAGGASKPDGRATHPREEATPRMEELVDAPSQEYATP